MKKSSSKRRTALVVLGMHRSGTSALTRVLNLAGAFLPSELMPPVPGNNERGFWEPVELVAVNERALASAGVPWDSPRRINPDWLASEAAEHSVFELVRFVESTFADQPLFVLKDPRLCRTVPLLRRALDQSRIDAAFVLTLRHPDAVAASLAARDGIPRDHGRALWLRYMLDAERWTRGAPRIVIGFDDLMSDWRGVLARVGDCFGVRLRSGPVVRSAVSEFLEPLLVHHKDRDNEPLPALIGGAWSAMQWLQAGRDTKPVRENLDPIWSALEVADEVLGAVSSWEVSQRQRTELRAKTAERERAEAVRRQTEQATCIQDLEELLRARDQSMQALQSQLEAARAELESNRVLSEKKREELERGAKRLDERMRFLQSMAQAALERARLNGDSGQ